MQFVTHLPATQTACDISPTLMTASRNVLSSSLSSLSTRSRTSFAAFSTRDFVFAYCRTLLSLIATRDSHSDSGHKPSLYAAFGQECKPANNPHGWQHKDHDSHDLQLPPLLEQPQSILLDWLFPAAEYAYSSARFD